MSGQSDNRMWDANGNCLEHRPRVDAAGFPGLGIHIGGAPTTAASSFIFATEDGTIVGWNSGVNPSGVTTGNDGIIVVDHSVGKGAVYKGLAIATNANGKTLLYATNFRAGKVEVYGTTFTPVISSGAFTDTCNGRTCPKLPPGYAPFNIVPVGNRLIVTYALQDDMKHDDVPGKGHGVVNSFDLNGHAFKRLVNPGTTSKLNSPWGVALAPQNFGKLANALLIGNFGDGYINGFCAETTPTPPPSPCQPGAFIGTMYYGQSAPPPFPGRPVQIDGLWSIKVGNDQNGKGGYANTLYFTAGPNGEADGLFGALRPDGLFGTPPYPFPGP